VQAAFAGGFQVFWFAAFNPLVGTWAHKSALGGDNKASRIRVQSLGNDLFTHSRAVGVRGVYEIDAQFDSAPQNADGLSPICRLAPNSVSRDSHRAKSQASYREVASNQEFAGLFGGRLVSCHCGLLIRHMLLLSAKRLGSTFEVLLSC
jgi:hypothetical protein